MNFHQTQAQPVFVWAPDANHVLPPGASASYDTLSQEPFKNSKQALCADCCDCKVNAPPALPMQLCAAPPMGMQAPVYLMPVNALNEQLHVPGSGILGFGRPNGVTIHVKAGPNTNFDTRKGHWIV